MDKEAFVVKYGCRDSTNNGIIIQMCKEGTRLALPAGVWVANNDQWHFFLYSKCRMEHDYCNRHNLCMILPCWFNQLRNKTKQYILTTLDHTYDKDILEVVTSKITKKKDEAVIYANLCIN